MSRSLSPQDIERSIQKMREQAGKRTPEESKQFLISAGILQEDGSFAPHLKALEQYFGPKEQSR